MPNQIPQEEIDRAVAHALAEAEKINKGTLFAGAGDKPAPVEGLEPVSDPAAVDVDYTAARKAMAKAAAGEMLDDDDKAAMKAFMKKAADDEDAEKKKEEDEAKKALAKSVSDAVAAAIAARSKPANGSDIAEMRKSFEEHSAKQAAVISELAKTIKLAAEQSKANAGAIDAIVKGGNPGPKSGGTQPANASDIDPRLAQRVAQSSFDPRSLEKSVVAERISEQLRKGNTAFNASDLGNFMLLDTLRPAAVAALKAAYGA